MEIDYLGERYSIYHWQVLRTGYVSKREGVPSPSVGDAFHHLSRFLPSCLFYYY